MVHQQAANGPPANGEVDMLKSLFLILAVGMVWSPGAAVAKMDCPTYCQTVRCTPQNASSNASYCLSRCLAACNNTKSK